MDFSLKVFAFSILSVSLVNSAKILGVFPLPWGSHYILGTKLLRGLAEAGHDITIIAPYKYKETPKNGSWTDVILDTQGASFPELDQENLYTYDNKGRIGNYLLYLDWIVKVTNTTLTHSNVQNLIKSQATFDAVIVEVLLNEPLFIFAHIFKCPLILLSSIGPNAMINDKVGNPSPASTIADMHLDLHNPDEMTFKERFQNIIQKAVGYSLAHLVQYPRNNKLMHEIFPDAPDFNQLIYNASLVLLNSHPSITGSVPLVPNMIEVGGYYIDPPKKLPKDLQEFLDGAIDGAIYFSMGSHLKSESMPEAYKEIFLKVFGRLNQKVLWKFEDDLPGKADNIMVKGWMPQQDILAHPNVKLFITHGGLLSASEAIYHGVPLLVIPVFADQNLNADKTVKGGYGLSIPYKSLSETKLFDLIEELLTRSKYSETIKQKSQIFRDRPMEPLQTAIYWVEYVIRHKGAKHLSAPGKGISWYKYYNFDVYFAVLLVFLVAVLGLSYIFKFLFRFRNVAKLKNI